MVDYAVESVLSKDSLDMTDEDRQSLRRRVAADPCRRIVITHGTDRMIQRRSACAASRRRPLS